jgi:uncharacterized protein
LNINQFGAADLKRAFLAGTAALNSHKDYVNELNVFPVPDGDTGTNMSMTLNCAATEVAKLPDEPEMATLCKAISSGTLRGARGNSGVILSQLLRGFCKEIREYQTVDTILLASAFARAVDSAYKAVMKPKEGTILTVAKSMSESAAEHAVTQDDIKQFMEMVLADGQASLEHTPDLLPVLKEAGVVDSGGQGLIYAMQGALEGLLDENYVYDPEAGDGAAKEQPAAQADEEQLRAKFSYMAQIAITVSMDKTGAAQGKTEPGKIRSRLGALGTVTACDEQSGQVTVQVYTEDPGMALHEAMAFGRLAEVKVEILHKEDAPAADTADKPEKPGEAAQESCAGAAKTSQHKQSGFVTVAVGSGIEEIFQSLGVDVVISGGQTMNPCTEDFLKAIDEIDADDIYLIPNNKNIVMAANQAAIMQQGKNVKVVPTTTIPQGIAALIAFDQGADAEANKDTMSEAAGCVKTCEVTYAVRDTSIDGFSIHENDIMAIADGKIAAVGRSIDDTVVEAVTKLVDDSSELVSLYYGDNVDHEEAEKLVARISELLPSVDVELNAGGQPVYFYLISVE